MRYISYLLLIILFSSSSFSQEKRKGWEEFKIGMPLDEGRNLLQKRCVEVSEDMVLGGFNCGIFFGKPLSIFLHEKNKYLFFSPYVQSISLSIDTEDKSLVEEVFKYLMKNHKNIKNYKNFECKEEICSWSFDDNFDVHLMIMRDPIDKSTYVITIRYKDILNY